jgi:hypothetical protein
VAISAGQAIFTSVAGSAGEAAVTTAANVVALRKVPVNSLAPLEGALF